MQQLLISFHTLLCWHDKPCFCFFAVLKNWKLKKKKRLLCFDLCMPRWIRHMSWSSSSPGCYASARENSLPGWLDQVNQSSIPELQSFAAGIEKDKEAVRAGLTWWINNGMVEGHVTKLKLIRTTGLWAGRLSTTAQACPSRRVGGDSSARSLLALNV
jgi:hypothetical protein